MILSVAVKNLTLNRSMDGGQALLSGVSCACRQPSQRCEGSRETGQQDWHCGDATMTGLAASHSSVVQGGVRHSPLDSNNSVVGGHAGSTPAASTNGSRGQLVRHSMTLDR